MFPDLSVLWVIFFVLVLTILLERLLLRPLQRVMHQREDATRSARALAERSALEAREAAAEFERKTAAARAEVYRQMDDMRRTALAERTEILAQTRAQAEQEIAAASAQLHADSEEARRRLAADAEALGAEAAERILGRARILIDSFAQFIGARNNTEDAYATRQSAGSHPAPAARSVAVVWCCGLRTGA